MPLFQEWGKAFIERLKYSEHQSYMAFLSILKKKGYKELASHLKEAVEVKCYSHDSVEGLFDKHLSSSRMSEKKQLQINQDMNQLIRRKKFEWDNKMIEYKGKITTCCKKVIRTVENNSDISIDEQNDIIRQMEDLNEKLENYFLSDEHKNSRDIHDELKNQKEELRRLKDLFAETEKALKATTGENETLKKDIQQLNQELEQKITELNDLDFALQQEKVDSSRDKEAFLAKMDEIANSIRSELTANFEKQTKDINKELKETKDKVDQLQAEIRQGRRKSDEEHLDLAACSKSDVTKSKYKGKN